METTETRDDLSGLLRLLEERLLHPGVRHSASELGELLADDFVEFGSSGQVYDKTAIIEALASQPAIRISMLDFRAMPLAPEVALVSYRALSSDAEGAVVHHSLRSSIWRKSDGRWQMVFHQGTPIESL